MRHSFATPPHSDATALIHTHHKHTHTLTLQHLCASLLPHSYPHTHHTHTHADTHTTTPLGSTPAHARQQHTLPTPTLHFVMYLVARLTTESAMLLLRIIVKRDLYTSKETNINQKKPTKESAVARNSQKRPIYIKRDQYESKETNQRVCSREK